MEGFVQRLLQEKKELDEKIEKLEAFLESEKAGEIQYAQLSLLEIQLRAMQTYQEILFKRIVFTEKQ